MQSTETPTAVAVTRHVAETPASASEGRLLQDGIPIELQTLTIEQVAMLLHRSAKSVRVDVSRKPNSLPPVFRQPGSRKVCFRVVDVQRWMEALSAMEIARRKAAAETARTLGVNAPAKPPRRLLENSRRVLEGRTTPLIGDAS